MQQPTVYPAPKSGGLELKETPVAPCLKVIELFAGVGGFRIGLEAANKALKREAFKVVWGNQWEPSTIRQHAWEVYKSHWKESDENNRDIAKVPADAIPKVDLLVGGFPCQDYSVARTLNQAVGLRGKKGVLWWQIHRLLDEKRPAFGLFENVDRLLKSPASQRGRDFAVMLASLADIGYVAEWRVINAGDHGFPQRRKRVFILAYRKDTAFAEAAAAGRADWLLKSGVMAQAFPCAQKEGRELVDGGSLRLEGDWADLTERFNEGPTGKTPFQDAGLLLGREIITCKTEPRYSGKRQALGTILLPTKEVPDSYFIPAEELPKWKFLKGGKSLERRKANGVVYSYDEGPIAFPDHLDRPSRTVVTGEGGATPSRFKHVVRTEDGRLRRLMPVELERLNGFPDHHTKVDGISDVKRAFFMGNALVTGVVARIAVEIGKRLS